MRTSTEEKERIAGALDSMVHADIGQTEQKAVPYSAGSYYAQAPFVDVNNRTRSPSAIDLIRENLSTAFACTNLNAQLVASTPLRLYVRKTRRKTKSRLMERGDTKPISLKRSKWLEKFPYTAKLMSDSTCVEEVTSHPLLDLLSAPAAMADDSAGVNEYTLFEITQAFLEVVGRCYWYKDKGGITGDIPRAIWIMAPQSVQEYPGVSTERIIDKYVYMSPWGKSDYAPSEIVPFRMPDLYTAGYLGGQSPLRAVIEQIRLKRQVDANSIAMLQREGKPSAMYIPKGDSEGGGIGFEEAARVAAAIRMAFARAGQGGVGVMEFPGSLEVLQWPANDIVDMVQYQVTKSDICNAYDVPTSLLDRKDANLASAETGDYAHAKYAGLPRLKRLAAALNQFLVPEYDDAPQSERQLFLAYDQPEGLRNIAVQLEQAKAGADMGAVYVDEYRQLMDLEPIQDGKGHVRFIDQDMVPIDETTGKPIPAPPKPFAPFQASNNGKGKRGPVKRMEW